MSVITVPPQLENEHFIVLQPRGKMPVQKWSEPKHQYTASQIQRWLDDGWNYAVLYQSDLLVLDADDAAGLLDLGVIQALPKTFTVQSGRTGEIGLHLYFRMTDPPEGFTKIYLSKENGESLGDVRMPRSRFYNVGPNSIHPSGNKYEVFADIPIANITWEQLKAAVSLCKYDIAGVKERAEFVPHEPRPGTLDDYGFTCLDFLMPLKPHVRDDEVEGEHPIHGSTTGSNLTVKQDGSTWYCRRCGTGGNWIDALAVSEGIIDCSDVGREYTREEWKEINKILKKLKPDIYAKQAEDWWLKRAIERREHNLGNDLISYVKQHKGVIN